MNDHSARPSEGAAVLIVARSGRMLAAAAAAAGYAPWVIDLFGDEDTVVLAQRCRRVPAAAHYGFNRGLPAAVAGWLEPAPEVPIVAGSGFEHRPDLIEQLARRWRVCGVAANGLRRLRDVPGAFAALRPYAAVRTPPTQTGAPAAPSQWLVKRGGMSGGFHVRPADRLRRKHEYFQQRVAGEVVSAVLIAGQDDCRLAAVCRQLRWHPDPGLAFCYQGAMTWRDAPAALLAACAEAGRAVAAEFAVRGIFGLDFIWREDADAILIDINPRPPATLDLLDDAGALFAAHLDACAPGPLLYSTAPRAAESGQLLLYAARNWIVPARFTWPDGVADRPAAGQPVRRGAPLCTLKARGESPAEVTARLAAGVAALQAAMGADAAGVIAAPITISTVGGALNV